MFATGMIVLNIIINSLPGSFLRYALFWDKLRIKKRTLFISYTLLFVLQAGIFVLLQNRTIVNVSFLAIQLYKSLFAVVLLILPFLIIKIGFFANLFLYFLCLCYVSVITRVVNYIDLRFVGGAIWELAFFHNNIVMLLLFAVTLPLVFLFFRRVLKSTFETADPGVWRMLWMIPAMFFAFHVSTSILFGVENLESQMVYSTTLMTVGGMFLTCYVLVKTVGQAAETAALKENARQTERLLALQSEQYETISQNIEKEKAARHDEHHHLSLALSYLENGELGSLREYLAECSAALPEDSGASLCENLAASTIVRHYIGMAKADGTKVEVCLEIPKYPGIADTDLCIVLGNLMENAVEACRRTEESRRFISISSKIIGKRLTVTVDNSFGGEIRKDGGMFLSDKREGAGIGISSVCAVAEKYDGTAKFEAKDGVFQASVELGRKDG